MIPQHHTVGVTRQLHTLSPKNTCFSGFSIARFFLTALVACSITYFTIVFISIPGTSFFGFPTEHDDYNNLSRSLRDSRAFGIRPVSTLFLALLSDLGITPFYIALHSLTIVYPALALTFLAALFNVPRLSILGFLPIATLIYSLEVTIFYSRYTGLITNLLSTTLAAAALLAMFHGFRGDRVKPVPLALGLLSTLLSFMAKEDAFLPVLLLCVFLSFQNIATDRKKMLFSVILAISLTAIFVLFLWYQAVFKASPFLNQVEGPYHKVLTLKSLLSTVGWYLTATTGTSIVAIAQLGSWLLLLHQPTRKLYPAFLLAQLIPLSLIAPYATLPNHKFSYYAFNWVPWQSGCLLAASHFVTGGVLRKRRLVLLAGGVVVSLSVVLATWSYRHRVHRWYQARIGIAKNVAATIKTYSPVLAVHPKVGVVTPPQVSPWFATDGKFLEKHFHLQARWLVFVPKDGDFYQAETRLLGAPGRGSIEVRDLSDIARFSGLPLVRFDEEGFGFLDYLREGSPEMKGALWAEPNPAKVCDGTGLAVVKIGWRVPLGSSAEIRVGSPRGPLFACPPGTEGFVETGKWVRDNMLFILLDQKTKEVLATVTVSVSSENCP
ncbi:MAG: hypothetical protein QXN56_03725 [Candidatus Hadarchaeum sp.]